MKLVKLGAAVVNTTPLDWDGNRARLEAALTAARAAEVSLLCLPELCISGYGCEDAFFSRAVQEMALRLLLELAPASRGLVACVGLPLLHRHGLFNSAALLCDGQVVGFVAKRFLSGDGIHYEPRWFKPWPAGEVAETDCGGARVPIGDLVFDCGGLRLGFEICEDAWVAERPGGELARRGVDVILNPSASHFAFGKIDVRERLVLEGSRAFGVSYVYANLLGNESGRAIYDGGALIAANGEMVARGPRFSFADFQLTTAVVDIDASRTARSRLSSFAPAVEDEPSAVVRCRWSVRTVAPGPPAEPRPAWDVGARRKEEEFARAEALGLFDYLRKSGAEGFVVSLSGGADSSAVTTLVRIMTELAVAELGRERFIAKLGAPPRLAAATSVAELTRGLLACAYQATENSSTTTAAAARAVAEGVGAEFFHLDVDPLVKGYLQLGAAALGRPLTWREDDLALQNIQARARAPGVWLLANVRNALLLCTSNRSEAAVGYATMDGDTAGGLAPLGGIDKAFLRRWLRWLEQEGPMGIGPMPFLAQVTSQAPTAELQPPDRHQTDERDLMPYEVLDLVERAAVRDKLGPAECLVRLRAATPEIDERQRFLWIERFFRLWCRNQWKRERYAPSFHLDDENLDPKTWCRFPILSGSFTRELTELRREILGTDA